MTHDTSSSPRRSAGGQSRLAVWERRLVAVAAAAFFICLTAANAASLAMSLQRQGRSTPGDIVETAGVVTMLLAMTAPPVLALAVLGWRAKRRGLRWAMLAGVIVVDLWALPKMIYSAALLSQPSHHPDGAFGPIVIGMFGGLIEYAVAAVVLAGCGLAWLLRPRGARFTPTTGLAAPGPPRRPG